MSHYQPLLSDSLFGSGVGDKSNFLKVTWLALRQAIGPTQLTITTAQHARYHVLVRTCLHANNSYFGNCQCVNEQIIYDRKKNFHPSLATMQQHETHIILA